jgi:hypothetical protein
MKQSHSILGALVDWLARFQEKRFQPVCGNFWEVVEFWEAPLECRVTLAQSKKPEQIPVRLGRSDAMILGVGLTNSFGSNANEQSFHL